MVSISQSNTFHCILVIRLVLRPSIIGEMIVELFQQGLQVLVLKVTSSGMEAQDTHDEFFVVGQVGHRLDVLNVGML
jgi:hypothetical protein